MKKAFTLIELIFVIVIIGILSAVAIPKFTHLSDNAKVSAELSTSATVQTAIDDCHGEYVIDDGSATFKCGASITTSDMNSTTYYPKASAICDNSSKPFGKLMKNPPTDWNCSLDDSNNNIAYFNGPASNKVKYCKDNKPCIGKTWAYYEENGTFILQ